MLLRKKTKFQQYSSPKSGKMKQIDGDLSTSPPNQNKQGYNGEQKPIERMQNKIYKILEVYQKLQSQNKKKDDVIKQLEKQNQLLKQRLVSRNGETQSSRVRNFQVQGLKQPAQGRVIQRTFTPSDTKQQARLIGESSHKQQQLYDPFSVVLQQQNNEDPLNRLLRQSRGLEDLLGKISDGSRLLQNSILNPQLSSNLQHNKILSKRDQNRQNQGEINQHKTFMDVLGKIKDKINKFDKQNVENHTAISQVSYNAFKLSNVKSPHNLLRRPLDTNQSRLDGKEQTHVLKQIWNQRDHQNKKLDQLFIYIDQTVNLTQE